MRATLTPREGTARPLAVVLLLGAFLAQAAGAGAVLADDLRDLASGSTGLADNPDTPGPDLYAARVHADDIPDMPPLLLLGTREESITLVGWAGATAPVSDARLGRPRHEAVPRPLDRGPPSSR